MTLLTSEQLVRLKSALEDLSKNQLIWVSGYLYGLIQSQLIASKTISGSLNIDNQVTLSKDQIVLISASQTGNARRISEQLYDNLMKAGLNTVLYSAGEYAFKKISELKLLIFVTSTYGEGEPPEEAVGLYRYLFSKKASRMENTCFAVFSLGDKSYEHFAKAGIDFDKRLEELGANRLCDRVDVDVDFQNEADIWIKKIVSLCMSKSVISESNKPVDFQKNAKIMNNIIHYSKKFPLSACLLHRQKITSRNSIKDIHHLEIDISGSNLCYQPGDSLGVWYENDPNLVNELLKLLNLTGQELVEIQGEPILIYDALIKHYELTQNTSIVVKNIAMISQNQLLLNLINDPKKLKTFVSKTPIIDLIYQIPAVKLTPQSLLKVLRPIQPRFYSISSAQSEVGEEIHITVSVVRYMIEGRSRSGGASSYLVDRIQENDKIRIFVEPNKNFKLPRDSNVSIIMIGAGTGIAPFRAFMQQRMSDEATGKNWLFFGNLKFIDDFLYQKEWQYYTKQGFLNKIDTAWSRDQDYKIYVQDKLLQNSAELWSWVQEGAYVYVCGDAKHMARDVEQALIKLTSQHGNMDLDQAYDFWNEMRIQHRYQKDVY